MKIIEDTSDLIDFSERKIKDLLSDKEIRKFCVKIRDEKTNDQMHLKKFKSSLSIKNITEFIFYLAFSFISRNLINENLLFYISIILCFVITTIQIYLRLNSKVSKNVLKIVKYFLYFNIYFFSIILVLYFLNKASQEINYIYFYLIIVLNFLVLSNIFYFFLIGINNSYSIWIVKIINFGLIFYLINIYEKYLVALLMFFYINISIFIFKYRLITFKFKFLKILLKIIVNDVKNLNKKSLNEHSIIQIILKNEKIISNNFLDLKEKIYNEFDKKNIKKNLFNKDLTFINVNATYVETSYDNLIKNNNDNEKYQNNCDLYEILSNFFLNDNKSYFHERNEKEIFDKSIMPIDKSEQNHEGNKKVTFSKKAKFFSSQEVFNPLKNKLESNKCDDIEILNNNKGNTITPVIRVSNKMFNFSFLDRNNNATTLKTKFSTEDFQEKNSQNIDLNKEINFIRKDSLHSNNNSNPYNKKYFQKKSKFKQFDNTNDLSRSNLNKTTNNFNYFNQTINENESKNLDNVDFKNTNNFLVNNQININNFGEAKNLLSILKNLRENFLKKENQEIEIMKFNKNSEIITLNNKMFSILNNLEKKNLKNSNTNNHTSLLKHKAKNYPTSLTNENYIYLGNFFKKEDINSVLLNKPIYYDLFYKFKIKNDDIYIDLIMKEDLLNFDSKYFNENNTKIQNTNYEKKAVNNEIKKANHFAKLIHEFKTPITSIIGLMSCLDIKNMEMNKKIYTENLTFLKYLSEYVIYLITDLTQICKFSNNLDQLSDYKVNKQEVKLKEILLFTYEILITLLKTNDSKSTIKHSLKYDPSIDHLIVYTDEIRLKQILINFISNAVKFTKSGLICIEAKVVKAEKVIKVSILDSGIGIKEENKEKLFNDFYMIQDNSGETNELNMFGSGLGLSINSYFAKKLDHKIYFKSKFGKGSCFFIEIKYNQFARMNQTYNDRYKARISKPNNFILKELFEKSNSYKSIQKVKNVINPKEENSYHGDPISSILEEKNTCIINDFKMEFPYYNNTNSDSKCEQSILDKSHIISSFSRYINGN